MTQPNRAARKQPNDLFPAAEGGLRVARVPTKRVRREADGSVTVPLWLRRDGRFAQDLPLRLTSAEAETLHAQLCYALDDGPCLPDGGAR
jgi:hypothetical protein